MRRGLKFRRRDSGLLAEMAAETGRMFKAERMRDLFDGQAGIDQIALRLAYQMIVDER
jgi:hypothetical protein